MSMKSVKIPVSWIKNLWLRRAAIVVSYLPIVLFFLVVNAITYAINLLIFVGIAFWRIVEMMIEQRFGFGVLHKSIAAQWRDPAADIPKHPDA